MSTAVVVCESVFFAVDNMLDRCSLDWLNRLYWLNGSSFNVLYWWRNSRGGNDGMPITNSGLCRMCDGGDRLHWRCEDSRWLVLVSSGLLSCGCRCLARRGCGTRAKICGWSCLGARDGWLLLVRAVFANCWCETTRAARWLLLVAADGQFLCRGCSS